jgi:hypothetical protein
MLMVYRRDGAQTSGTYKMTRIKRLFSGLQRMGCAGHFGAHHKWWKVALFWGAVAAAALAVLLFSEK